MRLSYLAPAALVLAVSTLAAHADTYQYTLDFNASTSAVFDESSILTTNTTIPAADFLSSSGDITSAAVDPNGCMFNVHYAGCAFLYQPSGAYYDFQLSAPLTSTGTYTGTNGHTLTITDLSTVPTGVTPEPSTLALLGTGILGLAGMARRKFLPQS